MEDVKHNYIHALGIWKTFSEAKRHAVKNLAAELYAIKKETEKMAIAFGYAQACRTSIPVCNGGCCRHHFPKTFSDAELLAVLGGLTLVERERLSQQILRGSSKDKQCMLLTTDGCFLPFKSRPMVCTNAYPCFVSKEYWKHKEVGNRKAKPIFQALKNLILQGGIT